MPADVTSQRLEVVTGGEVATGVAAQLLEVVIAADVPATRVTGMLLEVVVAPDLPSGAGGAGGDCPVVPAGTRLWWALDVDIGGRVYYVGTRAGTAGGEVYRSGLAPLTQSRLGSPTETISMQIATSDDWAEELRTAGWLSDGGAARLYLVVEEAGTTRRLLWADGRADAVRWGEPSDPLQLQLVPSVGVGQMPLEQWVIDSTTRPAQIADDAALDLLTEASDYDLYEESIGVYYNVIIGYPGHVEGGDAYPCVPIPVVQWATYLIDTNDPTDGPGDPPSHPETVPEVFVHAIAGSDIGATSVYALDLGIYKNATVPAPGGGDPVAVEIPQITAAATGTLERGRDLAGQWCTWLYQMHNPATQGGTPEMWIGFTPSGGGGVQHNGRTVRGAADLFAWLVETFTTLRFDRGRHAAHARALNGYLIDTFVNEPVDALDWYSSNVLSLVPAAIVRGEDGVYLAHLPLRASRADSLLSLTAGRDAEYVGMATTGSAGVVNHLTYQWGPTRDGTWAFTGFLTREHKLAQTMASGVYYGDPRMLPHALCRSSYNVYRHRPGRLEMGVVWDATTAHRCAEDYVIRNTLPERTLTYTLRPDRWWVEPGMVCTLTHDRLRISERLCTVVDVVLRTTGPEVVLRPIRSLLDHL
jgi:hypothetical protein